ncbi:hypothetical protein [Agitococcus lubricus]|uniref:Outer membrane protein beta-barrel domain-containing protein n=1 Tax=Agitococcus lubricus TaxID=1077255 RepID=A0A2T5IWB9_9GAMM|nr:hypothetical protein [Agitococcus lubricus]PTQ88207.1 hypothetical protein C8N29_11467 [Agitococcus lubricus]
MPSLLKKLTTVALATCAFQATAADRPIQFPDYNSALTITGFATQSLHSTHTPGWGIGGDAVYSRDFFNQGGGFVYFPEGTDDPIFNVYIGSGYKRYAQLQYGFGTEGELYRFRSENDLAYLWVLARHLMKLDLSLPTRYENYPNNRWVVLFSAEKYDNRHYLDNVSVGLGLRY